MRYVFIALLSLISTFANAQGAPRPGVSTPASHADDYTEDLDIAKAVRNSNAASTQCGPVKGHVVYVDSQGVRHELDYIRVAEACPHS